MPRTKERAELGTKPVTFRLSRTRLEQVADLCQKNRRSQANMVQLLVEERLDQIIEEERSKSK